MKKFKKYEPEQIQIKLERATKLKDGGGTNADIARDLQIIEATLARWCRMRFVGTGVPGTPGTWNPGTNYPESTGGTKPIANLTADNPVS